MLHRRRLAAAMLFMFFATLAGGCATRGEKIVQSYTSTRETLTDAQAQVDIATYSLASLRRGQGESLTDSFNRYKDSVTKLDSQGDKARQQAKSMKDEQDSHIRAWQKEMETITDPTIKSSLESRKIAARSNFDLVRLYADDVHKAYDPFLLRNKEMVQALSIDLSPAGINSLSPAMDKITADGAALKQKLAAMQHAMDNIANGVSPIGT